VYTCMCVWVLRALLRPPCHVSAGAVVAVLVVEGATLYFVLDTEWSRDFLALAEGARSVLCCRVTPLQKALVVGLVKRTLKRVRPPSPVPDEPAWRLMHGVDMDVCMHVCVCARACVRAYLCGGS
jgi:hypothetical protein